MHDEDFEWWVKMYRFQELPVLTCWNCGMRGVLSHGGPFMICWTCEVMWARWQKPVIPVTYAPMYATL